MISNISLITDKVSLKCQPFLRPSAPLPVGRGGGGLRRPLEGGGGGDGVSRRLTFQTNTKLIVK